MEAKRLILIEDAKWDKQNKEPVTLFGKPWTHGADVMATWRRHGFKPPTEYRNDYLFKSNREGSND